MSWEPWVKTNFCISSCHNWRLEAWPSQVAGKGSHVWGPASCVLHTMPQEQLALNMGAGSCGHKVSGLS
jgi:hypothetical protein